MSTAKVDAKKIRRAVAGHADAIREQVAVEIVANLYALPFSQRLKWAYNIVRGLPLKESWASWARSVVRRAGIAAAYWVKRLWQRVPNKPEYVPNVKVAMPECKFTEHTGGEDVELAWLKDKDGAVKKGMLR